MKGVGANFLAPMEKPEVVARKWALTPKKDLNETTPAL
jgi:hypothetical protein